MHITRQTKCDFLMPIQTIDTIKPAGKTVLLRVDFNSPIDPQAGIILDDKRFREHLKTIRALKESRCIIITHQSRPGKKDFTSLDAHAKRLEKLIGSPVRFVDDIFGTAARNAVKAMDPGEILMLENARFNAEENISMNGEDAAKTILVRNLAKMGDICINDAFGTAHRSQPTIVGLPEVMPCAAGLLMEDEIHNLSKVFIDAPKPVTFILGGTKVDDSIAVAEHVMAHGTADKVLMIGVVANVFLEASGNDIGRPSHDLIVKLGYENLILRAKQLIDTYGDKILYPSHVAVREDNQRVEYQVSSIPSQCPVLDIGMESLDAYIQVMKESGTIVLNGPAGLFEDPDFAVGTYDIIKAASEAEFSVVGGGHTAAVIEKIGYNTKFSHISTGGGACIEFLTGKKLPAIAAMEKSFEKFYGR